MEYFIIGHKKVIKCFKGIFLKDIRVNLNKFPLVKEGTM